MSACRTGGIFDFLHPARRQIAREESSSSRCWPAKSATSACPLRAANGWAEGQADWLRARAEGPAPLGFRRALACVLVGTQGDTEERDGGGGGIIGEMPVTSPFGNFILVHALLQRIALALRMSLPRPSSTTTTTTTTPQLRPADFAELDAAFDRWRLEWQRAPESVLDVRRSKDSLAFASTALFGLAHVRLVFALPAADVHARFQTCDARAVAEAALAAEPPPRRGGPHLLKALLHAVHALNVPVQLGVDYLARCQAFFWSVQHAFCSFECAVFLSKWLCGLAEGVDARRPLTGMEQDISAWVARIVREEEVSLDDDAALDIAGCATQKQRLFALGVAVARIWARQFKASNTVWPMVTHVGEALEHYAALLLRA